MKFPALIKEGVVRVYKVRNRVWRGRTYHAYEIRYFNRSARLVREKKSTAAAALKRANQVANDIISGAPAIEMGAVDRERWQRALVTLYPTGVTSDEAMAQYAEAFSVLDGEISLVECARAWRALHPKGSVLLSVPAAVEEFLKHKQKIGVGERQSQSLRSRLRKFGSGFPCDLASVTAPMVDQWINGLSVENRTRNNYLGDVRNFFNWARRIRHYTQADLAPIAKSIVRKPSSRLWRPAEMRLILETARAPYRDKRGVHGRKKMRTDEALIPYLSIGAFAKVRAAELLRLQWGQIRWEEGIIVVRRGDAKTKVARKIVMPANLQAWLKPFAQASGPILPVSGIHKRLRGLVARAGLPGWRPNALRVSASTYHAILSKDVNLVSREAGNSPAILESEYLEIEGASAGDAKEWFEIFPDNGGTVSQILHLPLFA